MHGLTRREGDCLTRLERPQDLVDQGAQWEGRRRPDSGDGDAPDAPSRHGSKNTGGDRPLPISARPPLRRSLPFL
jgi:hypothetical protein